MDIISASFPAFIARPAPPSMNVRNMKHFGRKWFPPGTQSGRQVRETRGETSVNLFGPRNPEWETSVGDKFGGQVWETSGRQV